MPLDPDFREFRAFVASHNAATGLPDGYPARSLSVFPTDEWPTGWLVAKGIAIPTPADDGEVITIGQLLGDPFCRRPVRGWFRFSAGSANAAYGTLTDDTGSVKVRLDRGDTENYSLLSEPSRVEMILTPITDGPTVEEVHTDADYDSPEVEAIARRLLDRMVASFHADRLVPLPEPEQPDG